MKHWPLIVGLGLFILVAPVASGQISPPFTQCPAVGADTSCAILIVVTDKAINVYTDTSQGPFDGIEDTLIGVQNNSSGTLLSLPLSGAASIFSFDGDGLCTFITCSWPNPTTYEGPNVAFTSISSDQTSGTVIFPSGIPSGGSTFFSLELAVQTSCPTLSGQALSVPLEKQFTGFPGSWGGDTYDNYPVGDTVHTMRRLGCATTSSAMIVGYFGGITSPGALNTWLANNNGYKDHSVDWFKVATYATSVAGVPLSYQGRSGPNDFDVDNYLCSNNPVILQVTSPSGGTHFVVATGGKSTSSGGSTYLLNDPGYNCSELDTCYGNQYQGIRKFSSGPKPLSGLGIVAGSPVELLIVAPNGQETGFDPALGKVVEQIASSDYYTESVGDDTGGGADTNPVKKIEVVTPSAGQYTLKVIGTGSGGFTLFISGYDDNGEESMETFTGTTSPGTTLTYDVQYSPSPGSQIVVTAPFASFSAKVDISGASFQINSTFTLASGSAPINPLTQPVSFRLANYSVTIPPGSFIRNTKGMFAFEGAIAGVSLQVQIAPLGGGAYSFKVDGQGVNLTGAKNPVQLTLTIGASTGTTSVTAQF